MSERRWLQGRTGIWIVGDTASDAFMARVREWVDALPDAAVQRVHAAGVCIWTLRRLVDYNREWAESYRPTGWHVSGHAAVEQMEGFFSEGAWREGRRRRPAVFAAEEWKPENVGRWIASTDPYCLYHEIGHAVGTYGADTRPHWHPKFRRIYLRERRALLASRAVTRDLSYFTQHWSIGVGEVFAEAFCALRTRLPGTAPGYDVDFRRAFSGSLAWVRGFVDSLSRPHLERAA